MAISRKDLLSSGESKSLYDRIIDDLRICINYSWGEIDLDNLDDQRARRSQDKVWEAIMSATTWQRQELLLRIGVNRKLDYLTEHEQADIVWIELKESIQN